MTPEAQGAQLLAVAQLEETELGQEMKGLDRSQGGAMLQVEPSELAQGEQRLEGFNVAHEAEVQLLQQD